MGVAALSDLGPRISSQWANIGPGRQRQVIALDGRACTLQPPRVDGTIVKALIRAFRWRKLLETGRYATIEEPADGVRGTLGPKGYLTKKRARCRAS